MTTSERIAAVARRIVRQCTAVRAGENVYIEGRADSIEYLELLAFECERVGALPLVVVQSDEARHRRLIELPAEQLATKSKSWIDAVKAADVVFTMHLDDGKPKLYADVTAAQRGAEGRGRKLLADSIYDGTRRWIGSDFPTREQADTFGLSFDAFDELFWRALDLDYGVLAERAARVCSVLDGARELRITTLKGTDVIMGIAGRPLDRDIGLVSAEAPFSNLPAGEVALAPVEETVSGTVVFDVAFWDGQWVHDLEVAFERGVAHGVRAIRGLELFNETIASAAGGGDVVGELGIGLNHEVTEPSGYMLLDEKILGTIHIAVGDNLMLGGLNESSLHWDLLVMKPTVTVDGVPLLVDGDLVV